MSPMLAADNTKTAKYNSRLGAWLRDGGVHFRVWAPKAKRVDVVIEKSHFSLESQADGYFSAFVPGLKEGALYKFRLDDNLVFPDPCSYYQPQGPHGPSMVIDHDRFKWTDLEWQKKGLTLKGQVFYELHVGTFTPSGNYQGLIEKLLHLKELGVTAIELMPLAECPGHFNWGYDGVNLFAPFHVYGNCDDLKTLINQAHSIGLGVILDVVYNHLGPDGNYLKNFTDTFFTGLYKNDWGEAINYDGPGKHGVREFVIQNAMYWIREYHFDGLRLDATQNIYDASSVHILADLTRQVRDIAKPKDILIIGENEPQEVKLVTPLDKGGYGLDTLWNDDFHHTAKVALTGRREAYYTDYLGRAQEFISLIRKGFLYQGQDYSWQNQNRGSLVTDDIHASCFVNFLQNHDQVANNIYGKRMDAEADAPCYRAMTALMLLAPQTPLLFMGQEFGSSSPFVFFADHNHDLAPKVFKGRKEYLTQFPSASQALHEVLDPKARSTFDISKINWQEKEKNKHIYYLHADLLKLRREDEVFKKQDRRNIEGAVLNDHAFVLRYQSADAHRLILVNLGTQFDFSPCPEPLLAHPVRSVWKLLWCSESARYGGKGVAPGFDGKRWKIPGRSTQVFTS
jgi:maltooligosyltrehalose trehalohydrolase